jgi:putative cell wall-binding protein
MFVSFKAKKQTMEIVLEYDHQVLLTMLIKVSNLLNLSIVTNPLSSVTPTTTMNDSLFDVLSCLVEA